MATIAAKKAAKKWKKKVKNNTSTEAVMAAKAKQKADSKNIKAVLNGLVYTADGRIIRRGVGLGHSDSVIMKMREYIADFQVYFECEQLEYLLSVLPPKKANEKYNIRIFEILNTRGLGLIAAKEAAAYRKRFFQWAKNAPRYK